MYFMKQVSPVEGPIKEYVFEDADFSDGIVYLVEIVTGDAVAGTIVFSDNITLTTRGYVVYDIMAILPE